MKQLYTRNMSFNERLFVVADRLHPPVANRFIFEGTGVPDPERWRRAVEIASAANPGSRLVLKGRLGGCRWVIWATPPVIDTECEQGSFQKKRLIPETALSETYSTHDVSVPYLPMRVIFRTHHGRDGRKIYRRRTCSGAPR